MNNGKFNGHSPENIRQQIHRDQLALMYETLPMSMAVNMVLVMLLAYALKSQVDGNQLGWWLGACLTLAGTRLLLAVGFLRRRELLSDTGWSLLHTVGVGMSALLWAWVAVDMFPQISHMHQALVVVMFAGLQFGVVSGGYTHPKSTILFVCITAIPLFYAFFTHPDDLSNVVAIMYGLYLMTLAASARRNYLHNYQGLHAGYDAQIKDSILHGSDDRFRAIVDNAGELMIVHDRNGVIRDINTQVSKVLGYARFELIGNNISLIVEDPEPLSVDSDEVITRESMFRAKSGELIPVDVCVSHYQDPNGQDDAQLFLARDLRMKKAEEQELRMSRRKLALHVRSTPLAVIEWDADLCVSSWNPAAEKIFGYTATEAQGRNALELLVPEKNRVAVVNAWKNLLNHQVGERTKSENITKDGRIICCDWYHTALIDDDGQVLGVASLAMDVTQRMLAEKAREEAKQEAEKASRAKSDFLSKMSHELRTPLNAIIGFSDLLATDVTLNASQLDYMQEIRSAGTHLLSLVNEVLDLSRIEHGKVTIQKEEVAVCEVLGTAVTMIRPLAFSRHVHISELPACGNVFVLGDKQRLTQVVINLLSNAVKYNREGGRVDVRCESSNGFLEITVSDTGYGIADADMEKVFMPFERGGERYPDVEGAGIGLMISRGLIEHMGGSLTFESVEGVGSCFVLSIPQLQKEQSNQLSSQKRA